MKLFKSIKWRLQIWYGLILVAVLAALGVTAYQLQRQQLFRQVDDELHKRIGVLANSFHHPSPREMRLDFGGPPPDDFAGGEPPPREHERPEFHLRSEDAHFFDPADPHNFYFKITTLDGSQEIASSTNQPDIEMPRGVVEEIDHNVNSSAEDVRPPAPANSGGYRQISNLLPSGEMIVVGCSIAPELHELRLTALNLSGIGGIILFLGLAGGWWISSRAIKPIGNISATAVKISAGDLSQRIDLAEADSELGQLASVLNSTFERLESAFAQQKQFASDAAHELRTPVSVILTQTQTALGRERSADDYKQTVEACRRAAERMTKLINALLELARLDAGQEQMKRLRFDLSKTVADSLEWIRPLAEQRGVKILQELSPIEIEGDSERLGQVVTNLLTNAIQYNRLDGEVSVHLKAAEGMAVLTVSDTGQGISAADLPRVFERFYRADQARSSGNAGLGLAISKAIIVAHGGTIDLASEPNVGTTFTIHLPATGS